MLPVAPVRCPPVLPVKRARASGISEMRLRGSGLGLRGSGYTDRTGWAAKLCSDVRFATAYTGVTGMPETNLEPSGMRQPGRAAWGARAGRRPLEELSLGVARTRTTRAVADGSTVPLYRERI